MISIFIFSVIEIPHPGLSYNPAFKDHQDLLELVKEREAKLIKQEEHLNRVTTAMFDRIPATERDIRDMRERKSGMEDEENDNAQAAENQEEDEDENEVFSVNPPVENKKKDRKARTKQKQQKELQKKLLEKKMLKKQVADINRCATNFLLFIQTDQQFIFFFSE